jgi:hypothetical protein
VGTVTTEEAHDLADALAGNVRFTICEGLYSHRHAYDELVRHGVEMMAFDKDKLRSVRGRVEVTPNPHNATWVVRWIDEEDIPFEPGRRTG